MKPKTKQDQHTHDLKAKLREAANKGQHGDTELIHANKSEEKLLKENGGAGTTNPKTGLKQFFGNEGGGSKESNSHNVSGNGGYGGNGGGGKQATGHQAAITQAATGQNMTGKIVDGPAAGGESSVVGAPAPTNINHPVYVPGDVPSVPNASLGQIIGTLMGALPGGLLNSAPDVMDGVEAGNFNGVPKGGVVGRAIDTTFGGTPGKQEGWANPDPNANGRTRRAGVTDDLNPIMTAAQRGRVRNDGDNIPDLGSTLTQVLSAPGVWPPVRASRGV